MIPIALPVLGEAEAEAARSAVLSGWITQGPEVAAFEAEFATLVGAPHACAVSNCTTALHLALLVAGVRPGDEVITVSHSFIATTNAIGYCGAIPVFVDIDLETFNISPTAVEEAITPLTRAILCVHQMGMPCDLALLRTIADAHGLLLIEDAACAIGSEMLIDGRWQPIGGPVGDIACFSFHPRKVITTGEGGMLTTRNAEFDAKFRLWRQHGMNVSDRVRHATPLVIFESYPSTGYNYRMTDIQAAIGRRQLQRLPDIVDLRRRLAARYAECLSGIVQTPVEPVWARSNWQSYCVRLPIGADQKRIMQFLLDEGVASRRGIMCAHREAAWKALPLRHTLVQSERTQDDCVLLPLYAQMTDADQDRVVEVLRRGLSNVVGRPRTSFYADAT